MEQLTTLIINFIDLSAEASPWLLLGLLIAGLMKAWVPSKLLSKHLGHGKSAIVKAALIGAPLPLCSCGVIPVAAELRRSGASAPATSSFLVATPETGVDSVSVSYALLGPIIAVYRPIAAIVSAILTGVIVATAPDEKPNQTQQNTNKNTKKCCASKSETKQVSNSLTKSCCSSKVEVTASTTSCCTNKTQVVSPSKEKASSCCSQKSSIEVLQEPSKSCKQESSNDITNSAPQNNSTSCCSKSNNASTANTFINKAKQGVYYASTQLIDDIIVWLFIGLIFASLVRTFLPEEFLLSYGSGVPAMLLMIVISIPMYICATASTPIAAGFIMAGLSPGTALVFMMAGPATNISTLGVIRNEMGSQVLIRYLLGVASSALLFGLLLDLGLNWFEVSINDQMAHSHELLPYWLGISCAILIALLACKPLRRLVIK